MTTLSFFLLRREADAIKEAIYSLGSR